MPPIRIGFLTRRGLAAVAPLLAGCLVLAGCGGSSNGPGNGSSGSSGNSSSALAGGKVTGSALAVSLTKAIAANQPTLKSVKVRCPSGPVTRYPVKCHLTASATIPVGKGKHTKQFTLPSPGTATVTQTKPNLKYALHFTSAP